MCVFTTLTLADTAYMCEAGLPCDALAAFGMCEGVYMGFRASRNWIAQDSSWPHFAQVTSAAPATKPWNLCPLECSHMS